MRNRTVVIYFLAVKLKINGFSKEYAVLTLINFPVLGKFASHMDQVNIRDRSEKPIHKFLMCKRKDFLPQLETYLVFHVLRFPRKKNNVGNRSIL